MRPAVSVLNRGQGIKLARAMDQLTDSNRTYTQADVDSGLVEFRGGGRHVDVSELVAKPFNRLWRRKPGLGPPVYRYPWSDEMESHGGLVVDTNPGGPPDFVTIPSAADTVIDDDFEEDL